MAHTAGAHEDGAHGKGSKANEGPSQLTPLELEGGVSNPKQKFRNSGSTEGTHHLGKTALTEMAILKIPSHFKA